MNGRIERVLAPLEAAGVRYLIVGGVAVVLHGYLRTTLDLDLVLHLEPENLEKALKALSGMGFQPQAPVPMDSFANPEVRATWAREKHMQVFSLWHPEYPGFAVDLFLQEPFDFDAAWSRAVRVPLQTVHAMVVTREDLMVMKRAAGRPRDLDDIEALSEIGEDA